MGTTCSCPEQACLGAPVSSKFPAAPCQASNLSLQEDLVVFPAGDTRPQKSGLKGALSACHVEREIALKSGQAENLQCKLRIIAVNDVYLLDNFPRLKTLVKEESKGFPRENVVTTLAGDFLAPSLLSSLDAGYGMVQVLNSVPVDMVCFGNHDGNDLPYAKLVHRIAEFRGSWLNTNIRDFQPELPAYVTRDLTSCEGHPNVRRVAFLGLCIGGGKWKAMYREDAFGGAHRTMEPVVEAARKWAVKAKMDDPRISSVLPLTHQDMPEDVELGQMGLFPAIIAGHDHDRMYEVVNSGDGMKCHVVKAGQDAKEAAIIDLVWKSTAIDEPPAVTVTFKNVADYVADEELEVVIQRLNTPVRELESAMLYELSPNEELSSVNAKFQDVSMAKMLATAVRDCLEADAAVVNSGAVRGNKTYHHSISYGDLKKECPYPSAVVVTEMPFEVLRDAVKFSRKPWWEIAEGEKRREGNSALQVDRDIEIDEGEHIIKKIRGCTVEQAEGRLFTVACDTYFLKKNEVFKQYCQQYPERIPPADAGRPLLPILVEFFCAEMWNKLLTSTGSISGAEGSRRTLKVASYNEAITQVFDKFDSDRNGFINCDELQFAVQRSLGKNLSSKIIVDQMIQVVDQNGDGQVTQAELTGALRKILHM